MDIDILKDIVLNIILIMFPILIYLVLSIYKDNITEKYNNMILSISLLTSLYLCIRFGTIIANNKILLFCNIPIVIAYVKKKPLLAVILSLSNILYCLEISNLLLIITSIKYLSYLILYIFANKRNLSINSYILSTAVLQGFFLSFEYFFLEKNSNINDVVILLILVFTYYFITFFIVYIFQLIDKLQELNKTIKLLEKDKKIKDSLFKLTHEIKMIDLNKKEKATKYINIMKEEINRSLNIMTDFTEFNKIKIIKKDMYVNTLLEDIYNSFSIIAKSKNIRLKYIQSNDIKIKGDYERLKQVLVNIIKNSIEAIDKKGIIEISKEIDKNYVKLTIIDNGIGMTSDTIKHLKEMFYSDVCSSDL